MSNVTLLRLYNKPILQQLQIEEALLRADTRNWCIINVGSPEAIVMGISGKIEELVDEKKLKQHPVPVIRRFSGGGTVVVDENTIFITLISNVNDFDTKPYPQPIMEWTAQLYRAIIPEFSLQKQDYAINDLKFGGNAQSITRDRWLHHSSLLWDFDDTKMSLLQMPNKQPEYRQHRSHKDFLCRLCNYFSSPESFIDLFIQQLSNHSKINSAQLSDIAPILNTTHRRMTKVIC